MHSSLYTTYTTHFHPIHAPGFPSTPPAHHLFLVLYPSLHSTPTSISLSRFIHTHFLHIPTSHPSTSAWPPQPLYPHLHPLTPLKPISLLPSLHLVMPYSPQSIYPMTSHPPPAVDSFIMPFLPLFTPHVLMHIPFLIPHAKWSFPHHLFSLYTTLLSCIPFSH